MTRDFIGIWLAALALVLVTLLWMRSTDTESEAYMPASAFPSLADVDIVFIGSSLAGIAIAPEKSPHGMLRDDRSSEVISASNISERLSNRLLAYAMDSGAEVIFLEINAYAHNYADLAEPALLGPFVSAIRQMGTRQRDSLKALFNSEPGPDDIVRLGAWTPKNKRLDVTQLRPGDYYYFLSTEPAYGDELHTLLRRARDSGVAVFFFSPPRPQSLINRIGDKAFQDLLYHIRHIAAAFDTPVWHANSPWPDDHFVDILAHTNARGRKRFRREVVQWYRENQ